MTSPAIRAARTRWAFWASLGFGTPGITSSRRSIQSSSTRAIIISIRPPAPFQAPTSLDPTSYLEPADLRCSNALSRVPTAFRRCFLTPSVTAFSRRPSLLSHCLSHCLSQRGTTSFPTRRRCHTPATRRRRQSIRTASARCAFHRLLTPSIALSRLPSPSQVLGQQARAAPAAPCVGMRRRQRGRLLLLRALRGSGPPPRPSRRLTPSIIFHYLPLPSITFHRLPSGQPPRPGSRLRRHDSLPHRQSGRGGQLRPAALVGVRSDDGVGRRLHF